MGYAPGLVGYSAVKVLSPTFYALRESRTPVIVSVTAVLMNATLSILLARVLGFAGLSLGTALASLLNASLLLILLRRRLGPLGIGLLASTFVRITIASAVMGVAAWALHDWLATSVIVGNGLMPQVIRVGGCIGVSLLILVGMARLLRWRSSTRHSANCCAGSAHGRRPGIPVTEGTRPIKVDGRPLGVVSSAHFMVDAYSNMYAPLLPLLMPRLGMSLQAAGTLMMVFQAASSLSQLAFGRLADRGHARALLIAGPLVSATVLSLMGLVHHQAMLAMVLVMGGLGVAAFHPPGAMVAHTAGGNRPGTAMSVFVTSGSIGFALSPLLVANAAGRFGLGATVWFLLPGVAAALLFARAVPALPLAPARLHGGGCARCVRTRATCSCSICWSCCAPWCRCRSPPSCPCCSRARA